MNLGRHPVRIVATCCLVLGGLLPGGCASPPQGASGPAAPPRTALLPHKDGVYAGTRTVQSGGPGCGLDDDVSYQIENNHVWLRTHRTRRSIDGQVEPDGTFAMLNQAATDQISGSVSGDRLSATETFQPRHGRHSGGGFAEGSCVARIEAHYVPSPATADPG